MGPPKHTGDVIESGASQWSPTTRNKMKQYWQIYAPSVESMMLSHDAPHLAVEEQEEIMNYVPPVTYKGKKVLELGAGIGRYTTLLCENGVKELTAVDFMEAYIAENRTRNSHFEGTSFMCADVTTLNFPPESFDMVFSNWLLMYLTDREVEGLLLRVLSWLTPEGYLFIRESCYHQSGNVKRTDNPTFYRTPLEYASMLGQSCTIQGETYHLIKAKSIQTYINLYRNPYQLCFLAQKGVVEQPTTSFCKHSITSSAAAVTEAALDVALLQESIHGQTWGCLGGGEVAKALASSASSFEGKTVLDANCGTGGLVVHFAQQGAARVVGLAPSPVCLHLSLLHLGSKDKEIIAKTSFEMSSLVKWDRLAKFDIVCGHLLPLTKACGASVLAKLKTLLKESGQMVVSVLTSSVKNSDLLSVEELQALATSAGFRKPSMSAIPAFLPAIVKELAESKEILPSSDVPDAQREDFLNTLQYQVEQVSQGQLQLTMFSATL